jgi:hypothetical protein
MADGEITLKIDAALAERLKDSRRGRGKSVDEYFALRRLDPQKTTAPTGTRFDAICDATIANDDGIPLEDFEPGCAPGANRRLPPPQPPR